MPMLHAWFSTMAASAVSASKLASACRANPPVSSDYGGGPDDPLALELPGEQLVSVVRERHRVALSVEQPERHLDVVLPRGLDPRSRGRCA